MNWTRLASRLKEALDWTSEINLAPTKFSDADLTALRQRIDSLLYPRWLESPNDHTQKQIEQDMQQLLSPYFYQLAMKIFAYNPEMNVATDRGPAFLNEPHHEMSHFNAEEVASDAIVNFMEMLPNYLTQFDGRGSLLGFLTMKFKGPVNTVQGELGTVLRDQRKQDSLGNLSLQDQIPPSHKHEDYTQMETGKGIADRGYTDQFWEYKPNDLFNTLDAIVNSPTQFVSQLSELKDKQAAYIKRKKDEFYNHVLPQLLSSSKKAESLLASGNNSPELLNTLLMVQQILLSYSFIGYRNFQPEDIAMLSSGKLNTTRQMLSKYVEKFTDLAEKDFFKIESALTKLEESLPSLQKMAIEFSMNKSSPEYKDKAVTFVKTALKILELGQLSEKHSVKSNTTSLHRELLPHLYSAASFGSLKTDTDALELMPAAIRQGLTPDDITKIQKKDWSNLSPSGMWSVILSQTSMDSTLSSYLAEKKPKQALINFKILLKNNINKAKFIPAEIKQMFLERVEKLSSDHIEVLRDFGYIAPALAATNQFKQKHNIESYSQLSAEQQQALKAHLKDSLYPVPGQRSLGALNGLKYKPNNKMNKGWEYRQEYVQLDHDSSNNINQWIDHYVDNLAKGQGNIKPHTMFDNTYTHRFDLSDAKRAKLLENFQAAQEAGAVSPHHVRKPVDTLITDVPPKQLVSQLLQKTIIASYLLDTAGHTNTADHIDSILYEFTKRKMAV